ncbi:hypothetical protein FRACYDRAFT_255554 [Fragilariopsis cylindrus CCMP1102]|uniref:S-adenosyl-L-methionine-dependent methyltransferase n=1 Tax=Fragilariopsis cylindrus CCMP1102 TaxID=635003 RepID=A0A1E7EJW2_9STRA|nr:hypothetical protein FRACYDRAFT_255554 [Fragilariopsis cylindrus CCMP1102]|eukprot:OEU06219.1 hypothetical protein FRACYDRAFT_255554 [Fragilariopsis cylindrus CCMP1102]
MSSNSNSNTTDVLVGRSCLAIVEANNDDTSSSNEHDFLAFAFDDGYRRVRLKLPPLYTASSDKTTTDKTSDEDEEQQQQLLQHLIDLRRISTTTSSTNDQLHNNPQRQQPPQPYLALPWREYSYGTSIDKDGSFVVNGCPIKINEISNSGLGTGTNIWDGAIALTKFLEYYDNNQNESENNENSNESNDCYIVRNKNILELGSGTGFVGISCYVAFQSTKVLVTDLEYSMTNLRQNIINNTTNVTTDDIASLSSKRTSSSISGEILDWFDYKNTADKIFFPQDENKNNSISNSNNKNEDDHDDHNHGKIVWIPDIILAADVVWVDSLVRPLVETLYYICTFACKEHKQSPIILLSYQRRSQIVENNLFHTLKEYNFHYEDVTIDTNTKIHIYKITYNIDPHPNPSIHPDNRR